jgi:mono/diheme cytochrome c family protein
MEMKIFALSVLCTAILSGCGEGSETSTPATKLTASAVVSSSVNSHSHSVTIPFADVSASPADVTKQYRSDSASGHTHVIAVSKQQMIDLNDGLQLSLTSSAPDGGAVHTHTWNFQGGNVLYEKFCYNCHSNGKRNHSPMNVSFNASQSNAVKNPGGMSLSNSPAVTPDPNYQPSTTPLPVDAASVYSGRCGGCHRLGTVDTAGSFDLSRKGGQVSVKFPTAGVVSHNGQSLTAAEITALAAYFDAN